MKLKINRNYFFKINEDYFFYFQRIIEKNKLMMAVELERTKDNFAYQTYVGIMFHKHAINFVINGWVLSFKMKFLISIIFQF